MPTINEAARTLGRIKNPKRAAASRENGKLSKTVSKGRPRTRLRLHTIHTVAVDNKATGAQAQALRQSAAISIQEMALAMRVPASLVLELERGARDWNAGRVEVFLSSVERIKASRANKSLAKP